MVLIGMSIIVIAMVITARTDFDEWDSSEYEDDEW